MATPESAANAAQFNAVLANLVSQLQQFNAQVGATSDILGGNFKDAAGHIQELHNPIYKLNAGFIGAAANAKKMGLSMEDAMTQASFRANLLVQRMDMVKARFMSLPNAFRAQMASGMRVEADRIQASAGIMRSEYAKSIPEAQKIISEVRKVVLKESAPLPGDTKTHLDVLSQTIDDSMKMAKDAGQSIEDAKKFSAMVSGRIGAIGGSANADQYSILRFANALMSGSLSANSRIDLVERNPAVKNAMKEVFKKRGVRTLEGISKGKRMEAVEEILEKAMPADQLDAASASLGGAVEGLNTSIKSMFDFTRTVDNAFQDYDGPDITVFDELKEVIIELINPMKSLIDAIIANPVLDPMTQLARAVSLVGGFFGRDPRNQDRDTASMDFKEAIKELGFMDFASYLGANATQLVNATVRGDKNLFGADMDGGTFAGNNFGTDVPSRIVNALVSKFRTGVDNLFAAVNGFINTTFLFGGLDIGGSIGAIMGELTNTIIYLFNNLLPILIEQTTSMFRRFREQINLTDLIRFVQLFNGMRAIWTSLQDKISKIAEDAPKLFSKVTEGVFQFSGKFAVIGALMTMFGGVLVSGAVNIQKAFGKLINYINAKTGNEGSDNVFDRFANRLMERNEAVDEAKKRVDFFKLKGQDRAAALAAMDPAERATFENMTYTREDRKKDMGLIAGPAGTVMEQHDYFSGMFESLGILNPGTWLENFGRDTGGNVRKNSMQQLAGKLALLNYPLMFSGGVVPEGASLAIQGATLSTGIAGNVMAMLGNRGIDPNSPEGQKRAKMQERAQRRQSALFGHMKGQFMAGDVRGLQTSLQAVSKLKIGPFGRILGGVLKPVIGILGKIPPGLITAIATNIPLMLGSLTFIMGIFKRAYAASPELQKAVGRFMTGLKNIFSNVSRIIMPIYKKWIQPVFKLIGDILAIVFNKLMDFLNFFTGGAFGEAEVVNISTEDASAMGEENRRRREDAQNEAIEQGKIQNAFKGFMPASTIITANNGFGATDVSAILAAATLENKMAPSNAGLVMANTSETILTAEQVQSGLAMRNSRANINVPKIDIVVNAQANQNPNAIANEVATVLMSKLRDLENVA